MSSIENLILNGTTYDITGDKVTGDGITDIVKLTQEQYDQIANPSSTTLYIIVEGA